MAISVADNFSYKGSKPLDARFQFSSVANMKNATTSDLYDGCWAYVTATKKYYSYDSSNTVDETTGKWREFEGGGGGGTTYTAGDGIDITNDTISVDEMPDTDMSDVVTPLPGTMSRRAKYSTDEQIVGEWIDGKPIYRKVFYTNNWVDSSTYDATSLNIDEVTSLKAIWYRDVNWFEAPYPGGNGFYSSVYYNSNSKLITFEGSATHAGAKNRTIIEYTKTSS